jgi:hypothetical protein
MITVDDVYHAMVALLNEGRSPSANAILGTLGRGNKGTVLKLREEASARLKQEGRAIDPTAEFLAAADPVMRKLWTAARAPADRTGRIKAAAAVGPPQFGSGGRRP